MKDFSDELLIIIVIYKARLEACESFKSILDMRDEYRNLDVFIYDNSPFKQSAKAFNGISLNYFSDTNNSGVSKAYNTGAKYAQKRNKKWVLLLDQDTSLPPRALNVYQNAVKNKKEINLFTPILKLKNGKIFSPSKYRFKRGFFLKSIISGTHSLYHFAPVNSGMLIRTRIFFEIGGYNENVKLDFADFQFIERFRKKHPKFFVLDIECIQDFSDNSDLFLNQKVRFEYYCQGAKAIEKKSFFDWFQYNTIVLLRALRLTIRFRNSFFLRSYVGKFLL